MCGCMCDLGMLMGNSLGNFNFVLLLVLLFNFLFEVIRWLKIGSVRKLLKTVKINQHFSIDSLHHTHKLRSSEKHSHIARMPFIHR